MNIFCTLFDSNYLLRGLALYESMLKHIKNFKLYILCMDEEVLNFLSKKKLENIILISLKDFEDAKLLQAKKTRTNVEYCWTCTPAIILYVLEKYNEKIITYLDADLYFYSNIEPIFEEFGNNSILITEHDYTKKYDQTNISGKYNVQFITIRNDINGLECTRWWKEKCIEWCYQRLENGKFGDQRYLDDWIFRFKKVYVLKKNRFCAPWNINNYNNIIEKENEIYVDNKKILFYHFHGIKIYKKEFNLGKGYYLSKDVKNKIYVPYLKKIREIEKKISNIKYDKKENLLIVYFFNIINLLKINKKIKFDNLFGIKVKI